MSDNGTVYYLYCLTQGARVIQAPAIGVDGLHPVFVRNFGEIGAALSEVEREEFCGDAAETRMGDLAWLGPRACRHEAAIEEVMRQAPVLPARFATLFTSLDTLNQSVLGRRETINEFFAKLGDQQEWAVKGLLDRTEALAAPYPPAVEESRQDNAPGARYFRQRRIRAQREQNLNGTLKSFCRRAAPALAGHSGGFRERKVLTPVAAGTYAEVVFSWAFLLSPGRLNEFRENLEQIKGDEPFPGLTLSLTGPWPPHSFVPDVSPGEKT